MKTTIFSLLLAATLLTSCASTTAPATSPTVTPTTDDSRHSDLAAQTHTRKCDDILSGTVIKGFVLGTANQPTDCVSATRTCTDGNWIGPQVYPTCDAVLKAATPKKK